MIEQRFARILSSTRVVDNVPSFFRSITFLILRDEARRSWL